MNIKKSLLLAGTALALSVLVAPGTAAAFQITDEGKFLSDVVLDATGKVRYEVVGSGVECTVHESITVNGTTVAVVKEEFTPSTCVGFGVGYKKCKVENVTSTSLPWSATVTEEGVTFSEDVDFDFSECVIADYETVTETEEWMVVWVNKMKKTQRLLFEGWEKKSKTVCTDKKGNKIAEAGTGDFELEPSDSGTYEIA